MTCDIKKSHDKCVGVSVKIERGERNEKSRDILQFVGHVRRQTGYWRDPSGHECPWATPSGDTLIVYSVL